MDQQAWRTLFHPFESGTLAVPGREERWLFSGASAGFVLPSDFDARVTCVQGNRASFLALERRGCEVLPEMPGQVRFDGALLLLGRYREDNFRRLHEAARAVKPGSLLVVAGAKTDGVDPLRKRLRQRLTGHAAKHHGVVFWLENLAEGLDEVLPPPAAPVSFDGMSIPAGTFSADGPDPGSVLLARHFDGRLRGAVADFGAGWGYLGVEAIRRCADVKRLSCFEAEWLSLGACRANLTPYGERLSLDFHWADLLSEPPARDYDWVIMNPPFHQGRAAESDIGVRFIAVAARSLKRGGHLLMVANRQLPYEATLSRSFAGYDQLAEDKVYKVFEARKR